jgi:hypothetical protein
MCIKNEGFWDCAIPECKAQSEHLQREGVSLLMCEKLSANGELKIMSDVVSLDEVGRVVVLIAVPTNQIPPQK